MSRLFYHVMQDNLGNLLFDVSGTMRVAGTGTLATIYGDEGLSVVLPNPMTNHASFGSFKCYVPAGSYDFYMAKSGYTFETLTGLQGWGSMALQDASNVAITGGAATLGQLNLTPGTGNVLVATGNLVGRGLVVNNVASGSNLSALYSDMLAAGGTSRFFINHTGDALSILTGQVGLAMQPVSTAQLTIGYRKADRHGVMLRTLDNNTGGAPAVSFQNLAAGEVGNILVSATATAYNTTSDARLKHDIDDLTGELGIIQALRPVRFKWNADDSDGHGFLAHEVATVLAGVITGDADAVNEDGTIRPQLIDYSKLVPHLVGACKSLIERVEALQSRVEVLEDAAGV